MRFVLCILLLSFFVSSVFTQCLVDNTFRQLNLVGCTQPTDPSPRGQYDECTIPPSSFAAPPASRWVSTGDVRLTNWQQNGPDYLPELYGTSNIASWFDFSTIGDKTGCVIAFGIAGHGAGIPYNLLAVDSGGTTLVNSNQVASQSSCTFSSCDLTQATVPIPSITPLNITFTWSVTGLPPGQSLVLRGPCLAACSASPTRSPSPSQTPTPSPSESSSTSPSRTPSSSPSQTPSSSISISPSPSPSPSNSQTPSTSMSPSPSQTPTPSVSPSPTQTPSQSPTPSISESPSSSRTPSPSSSPSTSVSPSSSPSSSVSPTSSVSVTPSPSPFVVNAAVGRFCWTSSVSTEADTLSLSVELSNDVTATGTASLVVLTIVPNDIIWTVVSTECVPDIFQNIFTCDPLPPGAAYNVTFSGSIVSTPSQPVVVSVQSDGVEVDFSDNSGSVSYIVRPPPNIPVHNSTVGIHRIRAPDNDVLDCGGLLLAPRWVATAASCLETAELDYLRNTIPRDVKTIARRFVVTAPLPYDGTAQVRSVKDIIVYPDYVTGDCTKNLALWYLDSAYELDEDEPYRPEIARVATIEYEEGKCSPEYRTIDHAHLEECDPLSFDV